MCSPYWSSQDFWPLEVMFITYLQCISRLWCLSPLFALLSPQSSMLKNLRVQKCLRRSNLTLLNLDGYLSMTRAQSCHSIFNSSFRSSSSWRLLCMSMASFILLESLPREQCITLKQSTRSRLKSNQFENNIVSIIISINHLFCICECCSKRGWHRHEL